jgi:hypothetical protein
VLLFDDQRYNIDKKVAIEREKQYISLIKNLSSQKKIMGLDAQSNHLVP